MISFLESDYTTSETFRAQLVCVAVTNGILIEDLVVDIELLDSSTATGEDSSSTVRISLKH